MRTFRTVFALICIVVLLLVSVSDVYAVSNTTQTGKIVNCISGVNVRSGSGAGYRIIGIAQKALCIPLRENQVHITLSTITAGQAMSIIVTYLFLPRSITRRL